MPTPLAHTMFGLIIYRFSYAGNHPFLPGKNEIGSFWPYILASDIPDIDLVAGLLKGSPDLYHRGITHTPVAAIVFVSAFILLFIRNGIEWKTSLKRGTTLLICYLGHLILDFFQKDITSSNGIGVPLLYPIFKRTLISPVTFFFFSKSSPDCSGFIGCFWFPMNFLAVAWEIAFMLIIARLLLGKDGFISLWKRSSWDL